MSKKKPAEEEITLPPPRNLRARAASRPKPIQAKSPTPKTIIKIHPVAIKPSPSTVQITNQRTFPSQTTGTAKKATLNKQKLDPSLLTKLPTKIRRAVVKEPDVPPRRNYNIAGPDKSNLTVVMFTGRNAIVPKPEVSLIQPSNNKNFQDKDDNEVNIDQRVDQINRSFQDGVVNIDDGGVVHTDGVVNMDDGEVVNVDDGGIAYAEGSEVFNIDDATVAYTEVVYPQNDEAALKEGDKVVHSESEEVALSESAAVADEDDLNDELIDVEGLELEIVTHEMLGNESVSQDILSESLITQIDENETSAENLIGEEVDLIDNEIISSIACIDEVIQDDSLLENNVMEVANESNSVEESAQNSCSNEISAAESNVVSVLIEESSPAVIEESSSTVKEEAVNEIETDLAEEPIIPEMNLLKDVLFEAELVESKNRQKQPEVVSLKESKRKTDIPIPIIGVTTRRSIRRLAAKEEAILPKQKQSSAALPQKQTKPTKQTALPSKQSAPPKQSAPSKQSGLPKNVALPVGPKKGRNQGQSKASPLGFIKINSHQYRCPKKRFKNWREATDCNCHPKFGDDALCGSHCTNRMMYFECVNCNNGRDHCTNRNFTKKLNAPVEEFMTEWKGWGLRAKGHIKKGQFIMEYVGEILDNEQVKRRKRRYAKDPNHSHHFLMTLNNTSTIDATYKANISRCMNHSCDPNVMTEKWVVSGLDRIGFFSIKEIKKGEELCFDYNFCNYGKTAQKCLCGSANCKGTIGRPLEEKKSEDEDDLSSYENSSSSCTNTDGVADSEDEKMGDQVGEISKKLMKTASVQVKDDAIMVQNTGTVQVKPPKKKRFIKKRTVIKDESDADEPPPRDETPESVEDVYEPVVLSEDNKADIEAMNIRIAKFDLKDEDFAKLTTEQVKEFGDCVKNCLILKQSCTLFKYFKIININENMTKQLRDDYGFSILSRHLNISNFLEGRDHGMMTVDIIEQKKTIINLFISMILIDNLNVKDLLEAELEKVLKEAYISCNTDFRNVAETEKADVDKIAADMKNKTAYLNKKIKEITEMNPIAKQKQNEQEAKQQRQIQKMNIKEPEKPRASNLVKGLNGEYNCRNDHYGNANRKHPYAYTDRNYRRDGKRRPSNLDRKADSRRSDRRSVERKDRRSVERGNRRSSVERRDRRSSVERRNRRSVERNSRRSVERQSNRYSSRNRRSRSRDKLKKRYDSDSSYRRSCSRDRTKYYNSTRYTGKSSSRSLSYSPKRRSRSRSVAYKRNAPSRSGVNRKRTRSRSVGHKKRSRSKSVTNKKRSRSRSFVYREKTRSVSPNSKRRSHSRSTDCKRRSPSNSPKNKKGSHSRSSTNDSKRRTTSSSDSPLRKKESNKDKHKINPDDFRRTSWSLKTRKRRQISSPDFRDRSHSKETRKRSVSRSKDTRRRSVSKETKKSTYRRSRSKSKDDNKRSRNRRRSSECRRSVSISKERRSRLSSSREYKRKERRRSRSSSYGRKVSKSPERRRRNSRRDSRSPVKVSNRRSRSLSNAQLSRKRYRSRSVERRKISRSPKKRRHRSSSTDSDASRNYSSSSKRYRKRSRSISPVSKSRKSNRNSKSPVCKSKKSNRDSRSPVKGRKRSRSKSKDSPEPKKSRSDRRKSPDFRKSFNKHDETDTNTCNDSSSNTKEMETNNVCSFKEKSFRDKLDEIHKAQNTSSEKVKQTDRQFQEQLIMKSKEIKENMLKKNNLGVQPSTSKPSKVSPVPKDPHAPFNTSTTSIGSSSQGSTTGKPPYILTAEEDKELKAFILKEIKPLLDREKLKLGIVERDAYKKLCKKMCLNIEKKIKIHHEEKGYIYELNLTTRDYIKSRAIADFGIELSEIKNNRHK